MGGAGSGGGDGWGREWWGGANTYINPCLKILHKTLDFSGTATRLPMC